MIISTNMIDRNLTMDTFSSPQQRDFTMKNESCQDNSFSEGYQDHYDNKFICPYPNTDYRASAWYDGWWNALMNRKGLSSKELHEYLKDIE